MDFKNRVVVVTGGAQGIGRCIAGEFQKAGATVCVIDKQQGNHFVGDLADKETLERFANSPTPRQVHIKKMRIKLHKRIVISRAD